MKRASQYFTDEEKKEIADAVLEAETLTSAEIVPVAATCSGRYDRAEDIIGVFSGIIVMIVVWTITPNPDTGTSGSWSDAPVALFLAISVIVGFIMSLIDPSSLTLNDDIEAFDKEFVNISGKAESFSEASFFKTLSS